jgi:hypothetical protein
MSRIQILTPVTFTDRKSTKTGTQYRAADVQGILEGDDGKQNVFALLLMAPRGEKGQDLQPGYYTPKTELRVNIADRMRLNFEIIGFEPVKVAAVPKAA